MDIDVVMERINADLQQFVHDNNTPELRRKIEKVVAKVLAEFLRPEDQIRIRRVVIRPGQRVEADLVLPSWMVPTDQDAEGEEWKS